MSKSNEKIFEALHEAKEQLLSGIKSDCRVAAVRNECLAAEAKLLEGLSGKELELLNKIIEANDEYCDLLFEKALLAGVYAAAGAQA